MFTGKRTIVFVLLFFIILAVFLFRPYFFGNQIPFPSNLLISTYQPWLSYPDPEYPSGAANKPMGFDNLRIFYPLKTLAIDLIKHGQPPLWNPYNFAGNTLLATYQSAVFHPMNWLFFIIPQIDAWSLTVILQPVFAGFFMYLFLTSLGLPFIPSLFGSITFSLSGFAIVWWEESFMSGYSMMVLPLLLFLINKLKETITRWKFILLTGILVWSIVSGWFQMTLYVFLLTGIYTLYLFFSKKISGKTVGYIILAFGVALLISGTHLIPSFEALTFSARSTTDAKFLFENYLLPLQYLATFLAPDVFGNPAVYTYFGTGFYYERMLYFGLIPFILTFYLLLFGWKHKQIRFWSILFLVTLSLALNLPTSWFFLYTLKLPFFSVIIPSRILFLTMFSGSVLAAYGLSLWATEKKRWKLFIPIILVGLTLAGLWCWGLLLKGHHPVGVSPEVMLRNLILPTAMFGIGAASLFLLTYVKKKEQWIQVFILVISLVGSLYFANKYLYFSDRRLLYPPTPVITKLKEVSGIDRFWSFGSGSMENNFATQWGLYSPEGYDSIFIRRYGELLDAAGQQGILRNDISRADALIRSTERIDTILSDPYRTRLLKLLGVKYLVGSNVPPKNVDEVMVPPPELTPIWNDQVYTIFELKPTFPRAFLVGNYEVISDSQTILTKLFDPAFDLKTTVILEKNVPDFTPTNSLEGKVGVITYESNQVKMKVSASAPALLFLSDNYYPGWKAYVDGKETDVYRADYTFRAVCVPQGEHVVVFHYQPDSWKYGVLCTGAGLLVLVVSVVLIKKKKGRVGKK